MFLECIEDRRNVLSHALNFMARCDLLLQLHNFSSYRDPHKAAQYRWFKVNCFYLKLFGRVPEPTSCSSVIANMWNPYVHLDIQSSLLLKPLIMDACCSLGHTSHEVP